MTLSCKNGGKAQAQEASKAGLKSQEGMEVGLIHKKGGDCQFLPSLYTFSYFRPHRRQKTKDFETKALGSYLTFAL